MTQTMYAPNETFELEFEQLQLLERQISSELDITHKWMQDKNGRKTELFKLSVVLFTAMVAAFASATKLAGAFPDQVIAWAVVMATVGYGLLNIAIAKLYIDDHVAVVLAMSQVNLLRQASDCILFTLVNKRWPMGTPGSLKLHSDPYWSLFGKRRAAPIDNVRLRAQRFRDTGDAFALGAMLALAVAALTIPFSWFLDAMGGYAVAVGATATIMLGVVAAILVITLKKMKEGLSLYDQSGHDERERQHVLIALASRTKDSDKK